MKTTLFFLTVVCGSASAQSGGPWTIVSSTLDGGGERATSGAWTLTGTVGQHDAAPAAAGGGYVVLSGFWPGVVTQLGDPLLTLTLTSPVALSVAWTAQAVGYKLQYSTNLQTWTDHAVTITGASSIPWSTGSGNVRYFFRLTKL